MDRRFISFILALFVLAPEARAGVPVELKGSPASMQRQHTVAKRDGYVFAGSYADLLEGVLGGRLVPIRGNADYRLREGSRVGVALPEVRLFLERLGAQYHAATGEPLVVTSLARPKDRQPSNSHALSVHPAGMAIDLRVSQRAASRDWLEVTLLSLENKGVLDVTRERRPPHYHVALFPGPYRRYVEDMIGAEAVATALLPEAPPQPPAPAPVEEVEEVEEAEPLVEAEPAVPLRSGLLPWFSAVLAAALAWLGLRGKGTYCSRQTA